MFKKTAFLIIALTMMFSTVLNMPFQVSFSNLSSAENLTSQETQVVALVNGTNAYKYDLELERIALNHSISNYAFRSGGSAGATVTAMWIKEQFESFGLETQLESFQFANWNMPSQPMLTIDEDGDVNTVNDEVSVESFQSEHYSWPTKEGGVFADLAILPIPSSANYGRIGATPIDTTLWNTVDTHSKIVLIGREIRLNSVWQSTFINKLNKEPPAAVIFTWWNSWMRFVPPFFSSVGGRPTSDWGPYFWNLEIPVGWVNYEDGLWIRNREADMNVSAKVTIPSVIDSGLHYNVVGRLQGKANSSRFVIVSGHYDTVMTSGFVDNGAGTSGVLELARVFADAVRRGVYNPEYSVLFVAFASEELGLVGATHFVMQHKAEMKDIAAVINLDSIGSDNLSVARTDPGGEFDLDELILKAASDLGISATKTEMGSSDQEVFRDPAGGENIYSYWWPGLNADIGDAVPIVSSTMLVSYPLFYSDKWNRGRPGWIHTSYDNSTSTDTLSWLESNRLEQHIKVAALSILRVLPSSQGATNPSLFPWWTLGFAVVVVVAVVTVVYFVKVRKPPAKNMAQQTD